MRHYLDHAATSPLSPAVREAMVAAFDVVGNPASLHASGRRARGMLEDARDEIASRIGADPAEVVFTSGGTEADNIAMQGGFFARRAVRPVVVASTIEHAAVLETAHALSLRGAALRWLPVAPAGADRAGAVPVDALDAALDERVGVCSLMWVNNETGVVQPVAELAERCREHGAWSHSDAVQALGHVPVDFAASGLDLLSVSAHKLGGPVGIGALVARRDAQVGAVQFGGGQERGIRSGTQAVVLAAGFAAAVRARVASLESEAARLRGLRERVVAAAAGLPDVAVLGAGAVSPAIVNLHIRGARADDVLLLLDQRGVDCSTGSACTAGVSQPSHVAAAMGLGDDQSGETVRFSFGWSTTDADIDALLAALPEVVTRARGAR